MHITEETQLQGFVMYFMTIQNKFPDLLLRDMIEDKDDSIPLFLDTLAKMSS